VGGHAMLGAREEIIMKINPRKPFYHGSPVCIEQFNTSFLNKGDQLLGAGFYFSDDIDDALSYASVKGNVATEGLSITPTLHTVKLDIKNPLIAGKEGTLTLDQVKAIILRLPEDALLSAMLDFGDVESDGLNRVINQAAEIYAGTVEMSYMLFSLASDMFDDHIDIFNQAVRDVLGYDGMVRKHSSGVTHVCAWFPEQIKVIDRQLAAKVRPNEIPSPD